MNLASLVSLKDKALESAGLLTFSIENIEAKPSKTGNVGFRATCDTGESITFWDSTADAVIDEIAPGKFRLKPGVTIARDGGLISAEASRNGGFWS